MKDNKSVKLSNLILIVLILFLTTFIVVFSINYLSTDKTVIKSGKETEKAPKFLSLMYETTPESGEYQVSTDSVWPANGYAFNTNLSKCENGSKMTYDKTLRKVKVETNKSDKCYVYFDMERVPVINSVTESNVTAKSITLTVNATPGMNAIKTYHFSKDDGANYVTSSTNSYTFNDLTDETDYKIKVKVEDINFNFSLETSKTVRTGVYAVPVINSINESNVTTSAITISANVTVGTNAIKTYYYSKDNGATYTSSSSSSYTFSGLSFGTLYNINVKVEDTKGRYSGIVSKAVTTKNITIADVCVGQNLAQCIKNNYQKDNLDYHNGLANGANDGSYRYSGANPNNYVCFGPGATTAGQTCPDNNLYRIIGVFGNQVKLIKKTSLGNKAWNSSGTNTWAGSTIDTYLNGEYLNSLTSTWSNKIASNTWQVGGMTWANGGDSVSATAYNYEVGPNKANVTFYGKIGLMYVSDYGFAASPGSLTTTLISYNLQIGNNWLFAGTIHSYEWTMSRNSDHSYDVFRVFSNGSADIGNVGRSFAVRPSFSLESSINLNGGNGTAIDPFRI